MATITTSSLNTDIQGYFTKELLKQATPELRLNEFAFKAKLPKKVGAKSVSFFRHDKPSSANVQALAEGVKPATTRNYTLTKIDVPLAQYGELAETTDVRSNTELIDVLSSLIKLMGQEAAIKADDVSRNEIVVNAPKVYAQASTTYAQLVADNSPATNCWSYDDNLDIATMLKIKRALRIDGSFIAVAPPQVVREILTNSDFLDVTKYTNENTRIFNGEVGKLGGIRYVEATNPFVENTATAEGVYDENGNIFSTIFLGAEAFGCVELAGDSPMSPKVYVTRGNDKADPLDQLTQAGWKAYYASRVLNTDWIRVYKSRSSFTAV